MKEGPRHYHHYYHGKEKEGSGVGALIVGFVVIGAIVAYWELILFIAGLGLSASFIYKLLYHINRNYESGNMG